jgi:hypothetical protein
VGGLIDVPDSELLGAHVLAGTACRRRVLLAASLLLPSCFLDGLELICRCTFPQLFVAKEALSLDVIKQSNVQ